MNILMNFCSIGSPNISIIKERSNSLIKGERVKDLPKKTIWFEMEENETPEQCIERMLKMGYRPVLRKEEPVFQRVDGEVVYFRQKVRFKGELMEEKNKK